MDIITYSSVERSYRLGGTELPFLYQVAEDLVAAMRSAKKIEAVYLGLKNQFGDDITGMPVSVCRALESRRSKVIVQTEKVSFQEGRALVDPVELATLVPTEGGLVLKVNAVRNLGVSPSFLDEFVSRYN